jgi:hypothetical protein
MPDQSEHEKLENLVDQPGQAAKSARSLREEAASGESLEGFQAMNNERFSPELIKEAEQDDPQDRERGHPVPEENDAPVTGEASRVK